MNVKSSKRFKVEITVSQMLTALSIFFKDSKDETP